MIFHTQLKPLFTPRYSHSSHLIKSCCRFIVLSQTMESGYNKVQHNNHNNIIATKLVMIQSEIPLLSVLVISNSEELGCRGGALLYTVTVQPVKFI